MTKNQVRYIPTLDYHHHKSLVPVSEEIHRDINRCVDRYRKRYQRLGLCGCPKSGIWQCDLDCLLCPYRRRKAHVSYEQLLDTAPPELHRLWVPDFADRLVNQIVARQALDRLASLFPTALLVGAYISAGLSERKALEQLNIPRTTYRRQIHDLKIFLQKEFDGVLFDQAVR